MIHYNLTCASGHEFDSWFKSSDAFDSLASAARLSCPVCGNTEVSKALMSPSVAMAGEARDLGAPTTEIEQALAALRRQVEENSEYVGLNFASEARKMHEGELPSRSIYGEAKPEDAKQLIEDGVPVAPLPFMPRRKTN
ncbi:DUF1178 family protein [Tabrizicola sp. J26]|uniref:DUF1178 family protein n=1 Tax=Alitabrizicola rongguiensis TaxID=2909234 RepID=UPI001F1D9C2D|nr:DUF1178 family protein [Tabrizicola rongguiensis]MCF1709025.1 DUF1178 family protein [Tabrizicola rongguiensis]